jgi:hypothetical protein
MSSEVWYWREGETQRGPITWEKLQAMAVSGKIAADDWVFREGWTDWKLACEAKDSSLDSVPPPPDPPPLPILAQAQIPAPPPMPPMAQAYASPAPTPGVPTFVPIAPVATVPIPMAVSAAIPMPLPASAHMNLPLPPLAPEDTVGDIGPMPPSPDGVSDGDVRHLRRVLRDGPDTEQPESPWNVPAIIALTASIVGLMFLAFEMGLLAVVLGGWCLYASSTTGNSNGKTLAVTAVAIGCLNVIFRILCATMDLGLTM